LSLKINYISLWKNHTIIPKETNNKILYRAIPLSPFRFFTINPIFLTVFGGDFQGKKWANLCLISKIQGVTMASWRAD
jgi:hypothetical protein